VAFGSTDFVSIQLAKHAAEFLGQDKTRELEFSFFSLPLISVFSLSFLELSCKDQGLYRDRNLAAKTLFSRAETLPSSLMMESPVLFEGVALSPDIKKAFTESYPKHMLSEVETKCLPPAINGESMICESNEVEAEVAVVALSTLETVKGYMQPASTIEVPTPLAVVLCNTKLLAVQVGQKFKNLSKYSNIIPLTLCATVSLQVHRRLLQSIQKPVHIVIGTPSRILQLCKEGLMSMAELKQFIMINADKALEDLDMRTNIQQIFTSSPKNKQVMLFGSQMKSQTKKVCFKFMKEDPFLYSDFSDTATESVEIDIMN